MDRALILPEIVSIILQVNQSDYGYLHTCLTINRLFYNETCRIVWHSVGSYPSNEGHPTVAVKHLAWLVLQDLARAQFYTNFVRAIMFSYDYDDNDDELGNELDEFRWHCELCKLKFPNLEQLSLIGWQDAVSTQHRTEQAIIHYLGPSMRSLVVYRCGVLSDIFFQALDENCPRLRALTLKPQAESTSMRGLQRYLENANLTSLDLRDESFRNCWSQNAFLPISRYLNLNFLSILDIEDSWVVALDEYSKMASSFIALKYLYTGLSTAALSKLHKHTPNLTGITLLLESFSPSEIQNILLSASKFHENEFLQIKFPPWAIIEGADLINLGRNCPNLQSILLGDEQRFHPKAQGISDSAIETLARSMPQLENLYMPFDPRDTLTFKALRSLGRHCPNLQRLTLSADIDWSECVSGLMDILFPKLWKLTLWTSSAPALQFNDPGQETIETWASHLGDMMPKLTHFEIDNQVPMAETELALMNTMREMLDWRMFRKFRGEE